MHQNSSDGFIDDQKGVGRFSCTAQHSVHPTGGSLRVFRQCAWLEAGSGKMVSSRPAHPRVTHTVGQFSTKQS